MLRQPNMRLPQAACVQLHTWHGSSTRAAAGQCQGIQPDGLLRMHCSRQQLLHRQPHACHAVLGPSHAILGLCGPVLGLWGPILGLGGCSGEQLGQEGALASLLQHSHQGPGLQCTCAGRDMAKPDFRAQLKR